MGQKSRTTIDRSSPPVPRFHEHLARASDNVQECFEFLRHLRTIRRRRNLLRGNGGDAIFRETLTKLPQGVKAAALVRANTKARGPARALLQLIIASPEHTLLLSPFLLQELE